MKDSTYPEGTLIKSLDDLKNELKNAVGVDPARAKSLAKDIDVLTKNLSKSGLPIANSKRMSGGTNLVDKIKDNDPIITLLRTFVSNNPNDESNTIGWWDQIPIYFISGARAKELRDPNGRSGTVTWSYTRREAGKTIKCAVRIQPASIFVDGVETSVFPGQSEQLIEEVLKKLLTDKSLAYGNAKEGNLLIKFSTNLIAKELKARGKERNYYEIVDSLTIMNRCIISVTENEEEVYSGSLLGDLVMVSRDKYESKHGDDKMCMARLPFPIAFAISKYEYRQFDYKIWFQFKSALTRWIYKRIVNNWKHASRSVEDAYTISFEEIRQSSALLQQKEERSNRRKVKETLDELVDNNVLTHYETSSEKKGNVVISQKYVLYPSEDFVRAQKAANKRKSTGDQFMITEGLK